MKKFLRKKPVMIAFIIAAVIFLAVEIGILVRPISYGLNYTIRGESTINKINVRSDKVMRQTMIKDVENDEDKEMVIDFWIYRDGHNVYLLGSKNIVDLEGLSDAEIALARSEFEVIKLTKEQYEEKIKAIKDAKAEGATEYTLALGMHTMGKFEFELFKITDTEYECPQAVAFVLIHGMVTTALIVFAILSVFANIKKKNKNK